MCKIYNTIGCLNTIQFDLVKNNIDDFVSLNELIDFKNNYLFNKQKIISDHTQLIQKEKTTLEKDIPEFTFLASERNKELNLQLREKLDYYNQEIENLTEMPSKVFPIIKNYWINLILCLKFWLVQIEYYFKINLFTRRIKGLLEKKNNRLKYLISSFEDEVTKSSFEDLQLFERKKEVIENLNNTIYGAFGEKKVENEFKKLSDDYILINDFCYTFTTPLYHEGYSIKTIQIDHLLISTAGIFLIETKNWSGDSINNLDLWSPVQQIHRTNFALFKILENKTNKSNWDFAKQDWGKRKIPIKNILIFTGSVPREQFQYIKILGLTELLSYVRYFTPSFSTNEIQTIADFLLTLSENRQITSKLNII